MRGGVLGDVEGEGGLAHGGAGGEDEQLAGVEAAGHLVELDEAGAEALDALAGVEEAVGAALEGVEDLAGIDEVVLGVGVAEFEQALLGAGEDFGRLVIADEAAVDGLLRGDDQVAEERFILDDADVAFEIDDAGAGRRRGRPGSSGRRRIRAGSASSARWRW